MSQAQAPAKPQTQAKPRPPVQKARPQTLRISELYGPVPQGEGALLGAAMPFVRVAGCNLSCSWCDSSYTWKPGYTYRELTIPQVLAELEPLLASGSRWVSLTGGEPTIYGGCGALVRALGRRGIRVIVETNGLRTVSWLQERNLFLSCSPKLPGSGQDTPLRRHRVATLVASRQSRAARERTQYKFVIATPQDLADLPGYCAEVGIDLYGGPGASPVYVQPDGYIQPIERYLEALAWLQEKAPKGVRVTPQVHRLVHGPDARAV